MTMATRRFVRFADGIADVPRIWLIVHQMAGVHLISTESVASKLEFESKE